jgi:TrmH family RNA methyltransferase
MTQTKITSPSNPRVKQLRKLLTRQRERAQSGLFAAEGEDLVAAAAAAGREPVFGLCVAEVDLPAPSSTAGARGSIAQATSFEQVAPELLASVSTLGSGTRAIGVYEQLFHARAAGGLCVYLHGLGDPGNVGAVLRSALAFGASSVALGPGCADPHSPKAVRASMGAIFSVPLARVDDVAQLPGERVALVAHAGEPLRQLAQALGRRAADGPQAVGEGAGAGAVTLLVGAEREGLPEGVVAACDRVAHIPIASESLNAAMAATVALYEISSRVPKS